MINSPWQKPFRGIQLNKAHPLVRGLVGCWIFNEGIGNKVFDLSGNGNDGILTNGPTWTSGQRGSALSFDGSDDYVNCGSKSIIDDITQKTISIWANVRSAGENNMGYIVCKDDTNLAQWAVWTPANQRLSFWHDSSINLGRWESGDNALTYGVWHHVVVTHDRSNINNDPIIYVDSLSIALSEVTTPGGTWESEMNGDLRIGERIQGDRAFDGIINEVQIYNRTLSPEEIKWLYREPYCMFRQPSRAKYFYAPVTEYSLDCAAGAFTQTGQVADTLKSSLIIPNAGTYTETGVAADLLKGSAIITAAGSYTETGQIAALLKSHLIDIGAASFTETGQAASLLKSSLVSADTDSYTLTGQIVNLLKSSGVTVDSGTYLLAGQVVNLLKSGLIDIETAGYLLTGQTVDLAKSMEIDADAGSYALTGKIAALLKSSLIIPSSGSYVLTGVDVDFVYTPGEGAYFPTYRRRRR